MKQHLEALRRFTLPKDSLVPTTCGVSHIVLSLTPLPGGCWQAVRVWGPSPWGQLRACGTVAPSLLSSPGQEGPR